MTAVSGPHAPAPGVTRCDMGGENLPKDIGYYLVTDPAAGWEGDLGASCPGHCGREAVAFTASQPRNALGMEMSVEQTQVA